MRSSIQVEAIAEERPAEYRDQQLEHNTELSAGPLIVGQDFSQDEVDNYDWFEKRSALINLGREVEAELASSKSRWPDSDCSDRALACMFSPHYLFELSIGPAFVPPDSIIEIARFVLDSEERYTSLSSNSRSSVNSTPPLSPASSVGARISIISGTPSEKSPVVRRLTPQHDQSPRPTSAVSPLALKSTKRVSQLRPRNISRQALAPTSANLSSSGSRRNDEVEFAMRRLEGKVSPNEQKFYLDRDEVEESSVLRSRGELQTS